jgi:hypothetical protein
LVWHARACNDSIFNAKTLVVDNILQNPTSLVEMVVGKEIDFVMFIL